MVAHPSWHDLGPTARSTQASRTKASGPRRPAPPCRPQVAAQARGAAGCL